MSVQPSAKYTPLAAASRQRLAVVGGGVSGMAAAIRMAAKGYHVSLYEAGPELGGKLSDTRIADFRFDNGPSLFTLPELLEGLFADAGYELKAYLDYEKLDLVCRYFYPDGSTINAWADPQRLAEEIEIKTGVSAKRLSRYFKRAELMYETTTPVFLEKSLHKLTNYLNFPTLKGLVRLPLLGVFSSMHAFNQRWLRDKRLVQLFDRFATYNGSDPYRAPATLVQIAHIEHQKGAWYPKGGMIAIRDAMQALLLELGVAIKMNTPVDGFVTSLKGITGLRVKDEVHQYDKVIFAGDIQQAYDRLLPGAIVSRKTVPAELSTSALIFHWGVRGNFSDLDLHNIFFSQDYKQEFIDLAAAKVPEDPTIYVYVSAKHNPADAPVGHENWFVMINTPSDSGQDWPQEASRMRAILLKRLEVALAVDVEAKIVSEQITTPISLAGRTGSQGGAIYGRASNNKFSAFLRHPNYSSTIPGLYFCGGSVHPGGGIPLCLHSARIVEQLIG